MKRWWVLFALVFATTVCAAGPALSSLGGGQIPELLKTPSHGERIIMFWALSCAYCEPNMKVLATVQRAHPQDIELVTVATDDISAHGAAIEKRLSQAGMAGYAAWAYTEPTPQRLNFLIDPNWGGETPRTIFILSNGERATVSGELTHTELDQLWPLPMSQADAVAKGHVVD